jgi:hypothetical protein
MIYFDSDMSKSINTVVYFDWKTVIYIYGIFKLFVTILHYYLQGGIFDRIVRFLTYSRTLTRQRSKLTDR